VSMLTKAAAQDCRPSRLRASAVVGLVALTVVGTALLLLHVHLRLSIRDLAIETRKLQKEKAQLESRRKQMASELEGLKDFKTIEQYGLGELGMVYHDPTQTSTLQISTESVRLWRECDPAAAPQRGARLAGLRIARRLEERGGESLETILHVLKTAVKEDSPA
jgi:hypothetical protein